MPVAEFPQLFYHSRTFIDESLPATSPMELSNKRRMCRINNTVGIIPTVDEEQIIFFAVNHNRICIGFTLSGAAKSIIKKIK